MHNYSTNKHILCILLFVSIIYISQLAAQTNIELIKDINPGYPSSDLHNFINVNGILYFVAFNSGKGLWKSDGTDGRNQVSYRFR